MSAENVSAVLFAEFDIDRGSVLRLQYPKKVNEDEGLMAELMLPEGTHNHSQDWTVFLLNRPAHSPEAGSLQSAQRWPVHCYRYDLALSPPEWVLMQSAGASGNHTAHWVSITPADPTVGEEAVVSFLMELGRGEYRHLRHHSSLQYSALQPDFVSMYSPEGEALGIHFRSGEEQVAFKTALGAAVAEQSTKPPLVWCLSHVSNRKDKTVRRGAQVKALAVCSRHQCIHIWKPLLLLAVDRLFSTSTGLGEYSESPETQCRYLFEALNALPLSSLPTTTKLQQQVHRLLLAQGSAQLELELAGNLEWLGRSIPLRVPLLLQPQEFMDTSLSALVRTFKAGSMSAFHALLSGKRVLFLGHSQSAEAVSRAVLSLPLMVCPPLDNVLLRCYPYTTLNNLDFLEHPGYIAGSTNPIFESHPEWWDVLCDLDTGRVFVSSTPVGTARPAKTEPPKLSNADAEVLDGLIAGLDSHYSEYWVRASLQQYAQQCLCTRRRGSPIASSQLWNSTPESVAESLEQLRVGVRLSDREMLHILTQISSFIKNEPQLGQLLDMLAGASPLGCLSPIAAATFHTTATVRSLALSILRALESNHVTKPLVGSTNSFLIMGYETASRQPQQGLA